jgi:hypothetical protein
MYDANDFEHFYTTHIEPTLPQLRAETRRMDTWHLIAGIAAVSVVGVFLGYTNEYFSGNQAGVLVGICAAVGVVAFFKMANRKDKLVDDLKESIIREIIKHLCPGLDYRPDEYITPAEYKASSLFRYHYDYFDGDDLVEGVVDSVHFRCSELITQYDAGMSQIPIFRGLFFSAKINSRFNGCTYVWPWDRVQLPTSEMDQEYRLMPMPHTSDIKTGDSEFENYYRVCSNAPSQAQEILSEKMMDNMLRLAKGIGRHIAFSFVAGRCYIAVTINKELLEPTVYDPGDKTAIKTYFDTISLIQIVIERLQLVNLQ